MDVSLVCGSVTLAPLSQQDRPSALLVADAQLRAKDIFGSLAGVPQADLLNALPACLSARRQRTPFSVMRFQSRVMQLNSVPFGPLGAY